jgi:hypothetical protein
VTLLELEVQESVLPREQRIREVFQDNGGAMTTLDLARACVDAGVWSPDEMNRIAIKAIQDACRRALNVKDATGLPSASRTTETNDDGQPIWKARQLWLFADYEVNVLAHIGQRNEDHIVAVKLVAECEARYGRVIEIPDLPEVA